MDISLFQNQKTAIIFIGIQGSGKTYLYNHLFADGFVHINLDTLHTRNKEKLLLEQCLEEGKSFVVDNTNPTRADRARYIPAAKQAGYRIVGCFLQSKLSDCIARNNLRSGKACVPTVAIAGTSKRLEMPAYNEGFDALYYVSFSDNKPEISKWRETNEL